jgi:hypothetical protein
LWAGAGFGRHLHPFLAPTRLQKLIDIQAFRILPQGIED